MSKTTLLLAATVLVCLWRCALSAPCNYTTVAARSAEVVVVSGAGCSGAVAYAFDGGSNAAWSESQYVVSGVAVLPTFRVACRAVSNISITYRDVAADAAAMLGSLNLTADVISISAATAVTNVTVVFDNVTVVSPRGVSELVWAQLVSIIGSTHVGGVRVVVTRCWFELPLQGRLVSVEVEPPAGAAAAMHDVAFVATSSRVVRWGAGQVRGIVVAIGSRFRNGVVVDATNVSVSVLDCALLFEMCSTVAALSNGRAMGCASNAQSILASHYVYLLFLNGYARHVGIEVHRTLAVGWVAPELDGEVDSEVHLCELQTRPSRSSFSGHGEDVSVVINSVTADFNASSSAALVSIMNFDRLANVAVAVRNTTACFVLSGLLNAETLDRIGQLVLVHCGLHADRVTLLCRHTNATFKIQSGAPLTSSVRLYILYSAGTYVFLVSTRGVRLNSNFTTHNVAVIADIRNGTFMDATNATGFDISRSAEAAVATSLITLNTPNSAGSLRNCCVTATDCVLTASVGTNLRQRQPSMLAPAFVISNVALLLVRASASSCTFAVERSALLITHMDFSGLRAVDSPHVQCFGNSAVNGINMSGVVVMPDSNPVGRACGFPRTGGHTLTASTVSIVDCAMRNPYQWRRAGGADALVWLPSDTKDSAIRVVRSGSGALPMAVVACIGCTLRHSAVAVDGCFGLASLMVFAAASCTVADVDYRVRATSITPALSFGRAIRVFENVGASLVVTTAAVTALLDATNVTAVQFAVASKVPWDAASRLNLSCSTRYNGDLLHSNDIAGAAGFLSQVGSRLVWTTGCGNGSAPPLDSKPRAPVASSSALARAALPGLVTAVVGVSVAPAALGTAGFSASHSALLQVVASAVRLRARCRFSDSDSDRELTAIGASVADNPTRIVIGSGPLSHTRGCLAGNLLLIVGGGALVACVRVLLEAQLNGASPTGKSTDRFGRWQRHAVDATSALFAALLQPLVAAATVLLGDGAPDAVVAGSFGYAATLGPLIGAALLLLRDFPLVAVACRARSGLLWRIFGVRSRWAAPKNGVGTAVHQARTRRILLLTRALIEPYRGGYAWMGVVELLAVVVHSVCVGLASVADSCRAVDAYLWAMLGMNVLVVAVFVATRPHCALITTVQSVGMTAVAAVVLLLSALHEDSAADALSVVQSCLSLLLLVPLLLVRCRWMRKSVNSDFSSVAGDSRRRKYATLSHTNCGSRLPLTRPSALETVAGAAGPECSGSERPSEILAALVAHICSSATTSQIERQSQCITHRQ